LPISAPEKRLLLFGASRGLGLAIAEEYLKLGWRLVATVRSGSGTALHDLVGKADGRLVIEVVDITDPARLQPYMDALGQSDLTCCSSMRASRTTTGKPSPMSRPRSSST